MCNFVLPILLIFIKALSVTIINKDMLKEDFIKNVDCALLADPIMPCWKNNCMRR